MSSMAHSLCWDDIQKIEWNFYQVWTAETTEQGTMLWSRKGDTIRHKHGESCRWFEIRSMETSAALDHRAPPPPEPYPEHPRGFLALLRDGFADICPGIIVPIAALFNTKQTILLLRQAYLLTTLSARTFWKRCGDDKEFTWKSATNGGIVRSRSVEREWLASRSLMGSVAGQTVVGAWEEDIAFEKFYAADAQRHLFERLVGEFGNGTTLSAQHLFERPVSEVGHRTTLGAPLNLFSLHLRPQYTPAEGIRRIHLLEQITHLQRYLLAKRALTSWEWTAEDMGIPAAWMSLNAARHPPSRFDVSRNVSFVGPNR